MKIKQGEPKSSLSLNDVVIALVNIVNLFYFPLYYFPPFVLLYFCVVWVVKWSKTQPSHRQNHFLYGFRPVSR
jgi:hypothetical protein